MLDEGKVQSFMTMYNLVVFDQVVNKDGDNLFPRWDAATNKWANKLTGV